MPEWIEIVLLGIIEGVTEFLPISSTGHLLLAQQWLTPQSDLFNIVIQSGAVVAVIAVFWDRILELLAKWKEPKTKDYIQKLLLAFFITGFGGLVIDKAGFELPETATPIGVALLVGGLLFLAVERLLKGKQTVDAITWKVAVAIGISQLAAAVFPGLSRSGATILVALALGCSRRVSVEFTFLLGVPTILAASGYKIVSAIKDGEVGDVDWGMLVLGTLVSAATAFVAVKWLLKYVRSRTFEVFGWYRIVVGALVLATVD